MKTKYLFIFLLSFFSINAFALQISINGKPYTIGKKPIAEGTYGTIFGAYAKGAEKPSYVVKVFKTNNEIPKAKHGLGMSVEEEVLFHKTLAVMGVPTVWASQRSGHRVLLKPFVNGSTLTKILKKPAGNELAIKLLPAFLLFLIRNGIWIGDFHTDNLMFDLDREEWVVIDGEIPAISPLSPLELLDAYRNYMLERLGPVDSDALELFLNVFQIAQEDLLENPVPLVEAFLFDGDQGVHEESGSSASSSTTSTTTTTSTSAFAETNTSASSTPTRVKETFKKDNKRKPILQGLSNGLDFILKGPKDDDSEDGPGSSGTPRGFFAM